MPKADIKRAWFRMASKGDVAEIQILEPIGGFWGIPVSEFKAAFDKIKSAASIRLLVSSPGGDPFDGLAIYNILSDVRPKLTAEVIGLSASAATLPVLAASKVVIGSASMFMIHQPEAFTGGRSEDLRKIADLLDSMTGQFADLYSERSKLTRDEALEAMEKTTYYTAEQAIDAGFADEMKDYGEAAACVSHEEAKLRVARCRVEMRMEVSRLKRETETALRDAGLSRSSAEAETARIFAQGEPEPETRGEPEGPSMRERRSRALNLKVLIGETK